MWGEERVRYDGVTSEDASADHQQQVVSPTHMHVQIQSPFLTWKHSFLATRSMVFYLAKNELMVLIEALRLLQRGAHV